jgi:hypothetical protein
LAVSSGRLLGRFEELGTKRQESGASPIAQETEMANANEAWGEQVKQKPAQELIDGERHEALLIAVRGVPPTECDFVIGQGDEAMVGDRHTMRVTAEVMENMLRATEGPLAVDHPVVTEELPEERGEGLRLGQRSELAVETELAIREGVLQSSDKLASKDAAEHFDGQKKGIARMNPAFMIEG